MVRELLLDKKNQSSAPAPSATPAPVKVVESNCVTCGGAKTVVPVPILMEASDFPPRVVYGGGRRHNPSSAPWGVFPRSFAKRHPSCVKGRNVENMELVQEGRITEAQNTKTTPGNKNIKLLPNTQKPTEVANFEANEPVVILGLGQMSQTSLYLKSKLLNSLGVMSNDVSIN
nr:hypothetical protein [Tanacetum cinerariifolium]